MSDLLASARLKVSTMSREEIDARRAFLKEKHSAKLCPPTPVVADENKTPTTAPMTPSSISKLPAIVSVDIDSDSPVTLGALLAARRLTPAAAVALQPQLSPASASTRHATTTICTTGGRRRLRRVCLSPVHDGDDDGGGGGEEEAKLTTTGALIATISSKTEAEMVVTSIANILPPPLLASSVIDDTDDSTSICLASLKASFSARKVLPSTQTRVSLENEKEDDDDDDDDEDNYDYQDGWLVDDDEEEKGSNNNSTEEEEEEDCDQVSVSSSTSDGDGSSATDSADDGIIVIDNDTTILPSPRVLPPPPPPPSLVSKKKQLESLLLLRDGAIHPLNGRILIREEVGLGPLTTASTTASRHTFRSRAARDALTLALYAEYNSVVFGGRLPPALLAGGKGADEKEGTIIPLEWRGRLVKTAGLTFTRTSSKTGARCARIALSVTVLDSPSRLATTLLHELCHAASWCIDGINRPPHGRVFNAWGARATAAYPKRAVTTCHSYRIVARFQFVCDDAACGAQTGRHSKGGGGGGGGGGACRACGRGILRLINAPPPRSTPVTTSAYQVFLSKHRAAVTLELGASGANPRLVLAELARRWGEEKKRTATKLTAPPTPQVIVTVATTTTTTAAIVVDDDDDAGDGDIEDVTDALARKLIL